MPVERHVDLMLLRERREPLRHGHLSRRRDDVRSQRLRLVKRMVDIFIGQRGSVIHRISVSRDAGGFQFLSGRAEVVHLRRLAPLIQIFDLLPAAAAQLHKNSISRLAVRLQRFDLLHPRGRRRALAAARDSCKSSRPASRRSPSPPNDSGSAASAVFRILVLNKSCFSSPGTWRQ